MANRYPGGHVVAQPGVLFVLLFIITGFLSIVASEVFGWIAALCALMIILYPGFFLSTNRAIPFWNTPFLPVIFIGYAALGASGIVLLTSGFLQGAVERVETLAVALIVINFVMVAAYLMAMNRAGGAAKESVRLFSHAIQSRTMWIGVVLVGMVLPLAIIWFGPATGLAGAGILVGCFLFRYCVLKAGVYVPAALIMADYDFSKLNRNNADLEREYTGMAVHSTRDPG